MSKFKVGDKVVLSNGYDATVIGYASSIQYGEGVYIVRLNIGKRELYVHEDRIMIYEILQ